MRLIGGLFLLCCSALAASDEEVENKLRLAPRNELASPGEFPFQVSIQIRGQHTCGGALVSKRHVLTAAHCVADLVAQHNPFAVRSMTVEVGSTRIGGGTTHAIKRIAHKRGYQNNPYGSTITPYDVAIITLKTPVTESSSVSTISIASSGPPVGSIVTIAGYGNTQIGGPTSRVLRKTKLRIVSNSECQNYYGSTMGKTIMSTQICAKLGPGYGTCQGDSGGPLLYNNQVFAVVSAGDGNCGAGNPDIFTLVGPFQAFIQKAMAQGAGPSGGDKESSDDDNSPSWWPQLPGYPGYPGKPSKPTTKPGKPKFPQLPDESEESGFPELPDYPGKPKLPGHPEKPKIPGWPPAQKPSKPKVPSWPPSQNPSNPGIPGTPGFPAPGQPGYPVPGQPGYPGNTFTQTTEDENPWIPSDTYPEPVEEYPSFTWF